VKIHKDTPSELLTPDRIGRHLWCC